jgi:glycerol-3-phosphate dehydrogenase
VIRFVSVPWNSVQREARGRAAGRSLRNHRCDLLLKEAQQVSGEKILQDQAAVAVEIHCAASHEGALHRDDILTRRTRTSIQTCDRGLQAARSAAAIVAAILGWDRAAIDREIDDYDARVSAELESQTQPDDRTDRRF